MRTAFSLPRQPIFSPDDEYLLFLEILVRYIPSVSGNNVLKLKKTRKRHPKNYLSKIGCRITTIRNNKQHSKTT